MESREIDFNAEIYKVVLERIGKNLWIHWKGQTWILDLSETKARNSNQVADFQPELKAPMPGKIKKVFVKNGDVIQSGDKIIAMEAMKMEYQLAFETSGRIKKVNVTEGQQVSLGEVLVEIEKV